MDIKHIAANRRTGGAAAAPLLANRKAEHA